MTDIDILAVRLPGAGRIVPSERGEAALADRLFEPDPNLVETDGDEWVDFIIAEVKEGNAELNRGAREMNTLITAIRRFAFVQPETAEKIARELVEKGRARLPERKVQWRLFAFGGRRPDRERPRYKVILHHQCVEFVARIGRHHALFGAAQIKNPTMNLLTILAKAGFLRKNTTRHDDEDEPKRKRRR